MYEHETFSFRRVPAGHAELIETILLAPHLAWSLYATALTAAVAPDTVTPDQPLLT